MTERIPKSFRLVLSDARATEDYAMADALYASGFAGAIFGARAGVAYVELDALEGEFEQIVLDAIDALERAAEGLFVLRVEPDELVSASQIARRMARSRQSVSQLIAGERGPGGFPAAVTFIDAQTRVWRCADVAAWFAEYEGDVQAGNTIAHEGEFLAAVNGALSAREHLRRYCASGGSDQRAMRVISLVAPDREHLRDEWSVGFPLLAEVGQGVRQRPVEADALLLLGRRIAERACANAQEVRMVKHLSGALSAYDDAVVLHTHRRDVAARWHATCAFSWAAALAGRMHSPGATESLRLWDDVKSNSVRPFTSCSYEWTTDSTTLVAEKFSIDVKEIQRWLAPEKVGSAPAANWERAFALLRERELAEPSQGERLWFDSAAIDDRRFPALLHVSFALTQAIAVFDGPLLAPADRHLLRELSEHVEDALARSDA
jgi:hypothetical protein